MVPSARSFKSLDASTGKDVIFGLINHVVPNEVWNYRDHVAQRTEGLVFETHIVDLLCLVYGIMHCS